MAGTNIDGNATGFGGRLFALASDIPLLGKGLKAAKKGGIALKYVDIAVGKFDNVAGKVDDFAHQSRRPSKIDRKLASSEKRAFWKKEADENPDKYDPSELENLQKGRAPIGVDGKPMEIHHVKGTHEDGFKPMTFTEHRGKGNYNENHPWVHGE